MNFSDNFKKWYWFGLLVILTILCGWRFHVGLFLNFDIYLFVLWFIVVLFPIISEISIFGLNVKKDIESAKNELKSYISQVHNSQIININTNQATTASTQEYRKKLEEETEEPDRQENVPSPKSFLVTVSTEEDERLIKNSKAKERIEKMLTIEGLVKDFFQKEHGQNYKPQIQFKDTITKNKFIIDGIIYKEGQIVRGVEIRYITEKSLDRFYYIALRFLHNLTMAGLKMPILFVIVSDSLDAEKAKKINDGIKKLIFSRSNNPNQIQLFATFFKFSDSKLNLIEI